METSRRTRRFEWCVRLSVYVVIAAEPFLMTAAWSNDRYSARQTALSMMTALVHVVADVALVTWSLGRLRERRPAADWPPLRLGFMLVATLAVVVVSLVLYRQGAVPILAYVVALSWAALAPVLRYRTVLIGIGVIVAITAATLVAVYPGTTSTALGLASGIAVMMAFIVSGVWLSGWMLRVHLELDQALADAARLATAEERLRISRDLHDVFGRTLATVALKSELAGELARRGRTDDAAAEMAAVRTLAEEAGREVRQVLRGYRHADLQVELRGAVSLLDAAGIDCRVGPVPADLDPATASTLAWVTREAVTNLIKHSSANQVAMSMTDADPLVMTIVNDGADDRAVGVGSGLLGMTERLAAAGGRLSHERQGDRFVLTAELPRVAHRG